MTEEKQIRIKAATIRLCHDTIRITIQVSRYDMYLDTFHLYMRSKNNRKNARIIDGLGLIRLFSDSQNASFELLV